VVGEVGLARGEEPGDGGHEVVVYPEPAHRVVAGGVDAHRRLVGVLPRDALVHLEEVAVALLDLLLPEALDGVGEVEVHAARSAPDGGADPAALVAHALGGAGGDVAGHEVAEGGVARLEVVVASRLGDAARVLLAVGGVLGTHTRPSLRRDSLIRVSLDW
jgi:hypothetical protein